MFFPDDGVRVAALSEYVGRRVAAEAYARMLRGDAQSEHANLQRSGVAM